ncbi:MAG: hypothetical protein Q4F37_05290 [Corynebacterium sp.]|nr:hypothetical protein [Corynebacterium sp.]
MATNVMVADWPRALAENEACAPGSSGAVTVTDVPADDTDHPPPE